METPESTSCCAMNVEYTDITVDLLPYRHIEGLVHYPYYGIGIIPEECAKYPIDESQATKEDMMEILDQLIHRDELDAVRKKPRYASEVPGRILDGTLYGKPAWSDSMIVLPGHPRKLKSWQDVSRRDYGRFEAVLKDASVPFPAYAIGVLDAPTIRGKQLAILISPHGLIAGVDVIFYGEILHALGDGVQWKIRSSGGVVGAYLDAQGEPRALVMPVTLHHIGDIGSRLSEHFGRAKWSQRDWWLTSLREAS